MSNLTEHMIPLEESKDTGNPFIAEGQTDKSYQISDRE